MRYRDGCATPRSYAAGKLLGVNILHLIEMELSGKINFVVKVDSKVFFIDSQLTIGMTTVIHLL